MVLQGEPETVAVPSESGKGQRIVRCPRCRIALWSHDPGGGDAVAFVRVGTLDRPQRAPPDVHIHIASKQPWVLLPEGVPAFEGFYDDPLAVWPPASLQRYRAARQRSAG